MVHSSGTMLLKLFLLFISVSVLWGIDIDENTSGVDILSKSYIYIDKKHITKTRDILDYEFKRSYKNSVGLGFVDMYSLWIKFRLKNTQNKTITKIIEYDNQETEDIYFYNGLSTTLDGMFHMHKSRYSINPIFKIKLAPYEERTYYIKAHSRISTLIAKVVIWNEHDFKFHDQKHKLYLFIFFSIIITLFLYNFMIYVFTKDKAYMYYVIYLFGIVIFQAIYLGIAQLYFFSNLLTVEITKATFGYISILVVPIILFTQEFLNTHNFPRIDKILGAYLYILPILVLLSYDNIIFNLNIIVVFIPLGITIIWSGFYALYKGEKQARFYIGGWTFVVISLLLSVVKSMGLIDISDDFQYLNEIAFVLEGFFFSIALAHRINILSEEKESVNQKLARFQRQEQERLKELVDEKTLKLQQSLHEKDLLYQELNHRVKNNLQMILALIKLQISKTHLEQTKGELEVTKNRINSISTLYEKLNINSAEHNLSTLEYTKSVVQSFSPNFAKDIEVDYALEYDLNVDSLVYYGLILNELVTNAMKYAFTTSTLQEKRITISLTKKEKLLSLIIADNGRGYREKREGSLGLEIVNTLVTKQLFGTINIQSENGTKITIEWEENE